MQSQSFPNFVHSSPKQRSSESVYQLQEQGAPSPVKAEPVEQDQREIERTPSSRQVESAIKSRSPADVVTPRARGDERWKTLETGILAVPVNPAAPTLALSSSASQRRKRKSEATDGAAQTKLAAFGFFQTPTQGRTTRSAAKTFEKKWEDEEDLNFDQNGDMEDAKNEDEERVYKCSQAGSSAARNGTTPRPRTSQRLGRVPEAPYHPSLRPAGIAELKKREKSQASSPSAATARSTQPSHPVRGTPHKAATLGGISDAPIPKLSTRDEPQPSSSDLTSLSSSSDEELFPGVSGKGGTAEEWFERIGDRRSSEFGSFPSI